MRRPALAPTVLAVSPFTTARWRSLPTCSTQYRPGLGSPPPILVWWPFPAFSTPSTSQSPLTLWNHYGSDSGRGFNSSRSAITRLLAIPTTPPSLHFVYRSSCFFGVTAGTMPFFTHTSRVWLPFLAVLHSESFSQLRRTSTMRIWIAFVVASPRCSATGKNQYLPTSSKISLTVLVDRAVLRCSSGPSSIVSAHASTFPLPPPTSKMSPRSPNFWGRPLSQGGLQTYGLPRPSVGADPSRR